MLIIFIKQMIKINYLTFLPKRKKLKTITSAGSNTLFRDNGVKGAVVKSVEVFHI